MHVLSARCTHGQLTPDPPCVPPHHQLNTGSSGRLHSRMEALNDGQVGLVVGHAELSWRHGGSAAGGQAAGMSAARACMWKAACRNAMPLAHPPA